MKFESFEIRLNGEIYNPRTEEVVILWIKQRNNPDVNFEVWKVWSIKEFGTRKNGRRKCLGTRVVSKRRLCYSPKGTNRLFK